MLVGLGRRGLRAGVVAVVAGVLGVVVAPRRTRRGPFVYRVAAPLPATTILAHRQLVALSRGARWRRQRSTSLPGVG